MQKEMIEGIGSVAGGKYDGIFVEGIGKIKSR